MNKKVLSIMSIFLLVIMLSAGCGSSDNSQNANSPEVGDTTEDKTFKVGLECDYPPFNWTQLDDSNGAVPIDGCAEYAAGYDIEIAKRIADGLGRELVIVKTEWSGLLPALTSGKIDAIIAGMSPTAERKESIDFSTNYYKSDLVMVVKKGGKYEGATSIQDFKGAKVTAQIGTFHYTVIDQIEGVIKEPAMDDFSAMRVALESGMIDGYISEKPEAVSAEAANENFTFVEFDDGFVTSDDDTAIAVGLVKESELIEEINRILAGISDAEKEELMNEAIKNQPKE
ncbi:ABC-type transporter, periplasmic subunit family 3 [Tepidanaerobacter acetatoxydans Re1]|uniref:ABC-type transporter, periplasmic subunit family 3 n=1 Tax=Tepidanaerobacter acetatoxydans (strain DSM 21804 / JCM 16047 / Re1) TaxID=1209989 RepID=F4LQU2_TEPAE|nr:transporter substrate-binding domain-containing protein [Tepidanaerobacter acetatoxydans]AEE92095.1 ABC-type transporter, periplasmic subunit family 3 [Tepidanaerobacter acetatoxydans Re1]CCP26941.1 ABC-type transporter, periplasmic subunit family 3 [Tepidanaerobacter acetatoxydans Re1]